MIAIVGAGISGLALAHDLAARGVEYVVLEQDARPGGVIRSARVDGHLLEWGPQRTRLVGPMRRLISDAGLLDSVVLAPADLPLLIYRSGRLRSVPMSTAALFGSDLISTRGKLRILMEPLTRGERADESVADYFIRKVGRETYANTIGPLYGGLYASDPADMIVGLSLTHTLREAGVTRSLIMRALRRGGAVAAPAACSFRDGMQMLPDALHRLHATSVRLGAHVRAVRPARDDAATARSRYTVQLDDGEMDADHIVFTGSSPSTSALVKGIAPDAAQLIGSLHYNPLAIVHLHSNDRVTRGLGYQIAFGEHFYTRGVTFNDALFDRRGVYTAYLGGSRHPEVIEWADEAIGEIAIAEFRAVTGASASVLSVARTAMPAWDRSWSALSAVRAPAGIHFCANWESRPGLPGRLARARSIAETLAGGAAVSAV